MDLFPGELFNLPRRVPNFPHLMVRPLRSTDFEKDWVQLLSQLSPTDHTEEQYLNRFASLRTASVIGEKLMKFVIVIEDTDSKKLCASASLLVEPKYIRTAAIGSHVEDVVVHSDYRGKHLGAFITQELVAIAKRVGCYKVCINSSNFWPCFINNPN